MSLAVRDPVSYHRLPPPLPPPRPASAPRLRIPTPRPAVGALMPPLLRPFLLPSPASRAPVFPPPTPAFAFAPAPRPRAPFPRPRFAPRLRAPGRSELAWAPRPPGPLLSLLPPSQWQDATFYHAAARTQPGLCGYSLEIHMDTVRTQPGHHGRPRPRATWTLPRALNPGNAAADSPSLVNEIALVRLDGLAPALHALHGPLNKRGR